MYHQQYNSKVSANKLNITNQFKRAKQNDTSQNVPYVEIECTIAEGIIGNNLHCVPKPTQELSSYLHKSKGAKICDSKMIKV